MIKMYLGNSPVNSIFLSLISIFISLTFIGCKKYIKEQSPVQAYGWISKADWSTARTVTLTFKENPYAIETSSPLVFNAGQPYILRIVNPVGNKEKHYYAAEAFYKTVVTRKLQILMRR